MNLEEFEELIVPFSEYFNQQPGTWVKRYYETLSHFSIDDLCAILLHFENSRSPHPFKMPTAQEIALEIKNRVHERNKRELSQGIERNLNTSEGKPMTEEQKAYWWRHKGFQEALRNPALSWITDKKPFLKALYNPVFDE